jgi:hypothetical protein
LVSGFLFGDLIDPGPSIFYFRVGLSVRRASLLSPGHLQTSASWIFVMRSLVNFWPLTEDVFGDVWHSPVRYGYDSIAVDCYLCNSLLKFDVYIGFLGIETWPRRRVFSVHLTLEAAVCFYCLADSTFS